MRPVANLQPRRRALWSHSGQTCGPGFQTPLRLVNRAGRETLGVHLFLLIDRNQRNGQALRFLEKELSALLRHRERGCWQRQKSAILLYMPKITLRAGRPSHKCCSISGKRSRKKNGVYVVIYQQIITHDPFESTGYKKEQGFLPGQYQILDVCQVSYFRLIMYIDLINILLNTAVDSSTVRQFLCRCLLKPSYCCGKIWPLTLWFWIAGSCCCRVLPSGCSQQLLTIAKMHFL